MSDEEEAAVRASRLFDDLWARVTAQTDRAEKAESAVRHLRQQLADAESNLAASLVERGRLRVENRYVWDKIDAEIELRCAVEEEAWRQAQTVSATGQRTGKWRQFLAALGRN